MGRPDPGVPQRPPKGNALLGCILITVIFASCIHTPAVAQYNLPYGFSASYETKLSYGQREASASNEDERIWENWIDFDYTHGDLIAGLRFVAFDPPDPIINPSGESSYGIDLWYAEYAQSHWMARGGHFYGLFGRGLTLRIYEDRTLRIDTNVRGGTGKLYLPDGELTVIAGQSIKGNAEDADRGRSEMLYGGDLEHGVMEAGSLRLGGSLSRTDLEIPQSTPENERLEPLDMKGVRSSATIAGVDLVAEYSRVDGPNVLGADRDRFNGPNFHGTGFYGSAAAYLGGVAINFDYKDYDRLLFRNNDAIDYILPPAVQRDHTFNLLNRHPHQLDTNDEVGYQVEVTGVTHAFETESSSFGSTSWLANWAQTRNHDPEDQGNHFDDAYAEVQQELQAKHLLTGAMSWQRTFVTNATPDPLRTLITPIADLRYRFTDRYATHIQYEHQHDSSDLFGKFDVNFLIVEFTRSPSLTMGILAEWSNKSEMQLELLGEEKSTYFGASLDYLLLGTHELSLFYGTRNAGFICVGGVCRFEPAFDGLEMKLLARF